MTLDSCPQNKPCYNMLSLFTSFLKRSRSILGPLEPWGPKYELFVRQKPSKNTMNYFDIKNMKFKHFEKQ